MYLLQIVVIIVAVILMIFTCGGMSAVDPAIWLDIPSLLLLALIVIPILLCAGVWKDVGQAFRMALTGKWKATLPELKRSEHGMHVLIVSLLAAGGLLTLGAVIVILWFVASLEGITIDLFCANLAVGLLPAIYVLILMLLLLPLKYMIRRHIMDYMESDE